MPKISGLLVAGVLVLLLCGVAMAAGFTMQINGVDYQNLDHPTFIWGDKIRFSGINLVSKSVYISLGELDDNIDWREPHGCKGLAWNIGGSAFYPQWTQPDKSWSYEWNSGDPVCKYPDVDTEINLEISGADIPISFPIIMKAKAVPTILPTTVPTTVPTISPTTVPTPDYDVKIAALEQQIADQKKEIDAQKIIIDRILEFLHLK